MTVRRAPTSRSDVRVPAPDAAPDSARALLDALRAVARELRVAERGHEQTHGLHPAQLHTLQHLAERPARSLAELAERTHTDPSSASVVVQRLVGRGLVERTEAPDDRRRTELGITAAGRALLRRAPASTIERVAEAIEPLGDRRADALVRDLTAVARALRAVTEGDEGR